MGKRLDALLGRSFKSGKFRSVVNLAFSRLTVLANQRQARSSHARSDVIQLLQLGHHDRALLRVEQVIKEQNLLDAYAILDSYCTLLLERINLLQQHRECPEELKEAISGLLFASSRCGDFPELQEIRSIFTARFGKEFTARAIELRNNCAVNPVMIQKLSARPPSLEVKLKFLKQIASENGITLKHLEVFGVPAEMHEQVEAIEKQTELEQKTRADDDFQNLREEIVKDYQFSDSMNVRNKYKDVAGAAQAAFESAAYAAAAARAAVELSQSKSFDQDDRSNRRTQPRKSYETYEANNTEIELESEQNKREIESMSIAVGESENASELKKSISSSSLESGELISAEIEIPIEEMNIANLLEKDLVLDESDVDVGNEESSSLTVEEVKSESEDITTRVEGNRAVSVNTKVVRGH